MRIEISRPALKQLAAHLDYVREHNPQASARLAARLQRAFAVIGQYPYSGRRQDVDGVRKKVVDPRGYLIFSSVDDERQVVSILAAVHPARRRPYADS